MTKNQHVKYLVVWSTRSGKDDFAAFEEKWDADKFYDKLTENEDTYSASVCKVVRSTDYGDVE